MQLDPYLYKIEETKKGDYKKLSVLEEKSFFKVFVPTETKLSEKTHIEILGRMVNKLDKERKTFDPVIFVNKEDDDSYVKELN